MESEEREGNAHLKSAHDDPHSQVDVDARASSVAGVLRVRKPYTITKQRERWTDEEHSKFLEALFLYRRNWRRIKEHIGTKTAVQIRSHAQKFFSKVVRDSGGVVEGLGTLKAIQIPPPRPKRKPVHPYPRKSGSLPDNGSPKQLKRQPPPAIYKQESSGSAASVLSAVGSETLGPPVFSIGQNCSLSPAASAAADSNIQDNGGRSPTATVEEDNKLLTVIEDRRRPPELPSIKLFGKIIMAADLKRSSEPGGGDEAVQPEPASSCAETVSLREKEARNVLLQMKPEIDSKSETNAGNSYPGLVATSFYPPPLGGGNYVDTITSLPAGRAAMYGINYYYPLETGHVQPRYPPQSSVEHLVGYAGMQVQGSWIGSDTASSSGGLKETSEMKYKQMNHSSLRQRSSRASGSGSQGWWGKSYVPSWRCAAESELQHRSAAVRVEKESYAPSWRCAVESKLQHRSATAAGNDDVRQQERVISLVAVDRSR